MTELPKPQWLGDIPGYTGAQMLQFRRDALDEIISLYSPDDTVTDFINKIQSLFGDDE